MKHASLKLRKKTHTFLYISETRYAFIIYKKKSMYTKNIVNDVLQKNETKCPISV